MYKYRSIVAWFYVCALQDLLYHRTQNANILSTPELENTLFSLLPNIHTQETRYF